MVGRASALYEGVRERKHVLAPLAQRGYFDGEHLQPEVEVLAEGSLAHHLDQIAVRGRDDAHVDALALRTADAADLVVLEHAQELYLHSERDLPDLVQQQASTARCLDESLLVPVRSCERAPDVAEELGLEKLLGQRRAVHSHELPACAAGVRVDVTGHALLPRPALAGEKHGSIRLCNALGQRENIAHGPASSDEVAVQGFGLAIGGHSKMEV